MTKGGLEVKEDPDIYKQESRAAEELYDNMNDVKMVTKTGGRLMVDRNKIVLNY